MADNVNITLEYKGGDDNGSVTSPTEEGFPSDNPLESNGSTRKLMGLATANNSAVRH